MADQLIFTSSVRGIKPGASGYCTVLRSPGIRSALEQALEKISVFEHGRCNQGRMVYTCRKLEIRDKTYYVLSRISDAGKDYTGRTNFLAHHLAFSKEELPDMSPADLLLHWPNWCQQWTGDPREEPVDPGSFSAIITTKPPVRLWKEQAAGVDGAVKLASDSGTSFILRSNSASDELLLQLIAEVFAVRKKFNKSSTYAWTTTFSVGLAVTGSAKSFKWLALRASDDYPLSGAGTVLDLDSTLPGASSANEELIAIAREGEYRPPPIPIPLTQQESPAERSIPIQGARTPQQPASPQKLRLGRRSFRSPAPPAGHATKVRSKKKGVFVLLACALVIVLFAAVLGIYQTQKMPGLNENYELHFDSMLELDDQRKADSLDPRYANEAEAVFTRMYQSLTPDSSLSLGEMLEEMDEIHWNLISKKYDLSQRDNAQKAFEKLREHLLGREKNERILATNPSENGDDIYDSKTEEPKVVPVVPSDLKATPERPLDLEQYAQVILCTSGEKVPLDERDFKLRIKRTRIANLDGIRVALRYGDFDGSQEGRSMIDPQKEVSAQSKNSAIHVDYTNRKMPDMVIIIGNPSGHPLLIGEFPLKQQSANAALDLLEDIFKVEQLQMCIVDAGDKSYSRSSQPEKPRGGSRRTDEEEVDGFLFNTMAKDIGSEPVAEGMLADFSKWASIKIIKKLEQLVDEVEGRRKESDDKPTQKKLDTVVDSYRNLISIVRKEKTIQSYFVAYEGELKRIESLKNELSGDAAKKPLNKAYDELHNDTDMWPGLMIESENGTAYNVTWSEKEWGLDQSSNPKLLNRRPVGDLFQSLKSHISILENEEQIHDQFQQFEDARKEFFEDSRKWKSIEFKQNGQVIATAKVNL
ncbi:MAG: hypothetical protein CML13_02365 [Puniceicoccaceae bacterium]|nr:hypothetical protein [Puniceicoccaceae bacterium]